MEGGLKAYKSLKKGFCQVLVLLSVYFTSVSVYFTAVESILLGETAKTRLFDHFLHRNIKKWRKVVESG